MAIAIAGADTRRHYTLPFSLSNPVENLDLAENPDDH